MSDDDAAADPDVDLTDPARDPGNHSTNVGFSWDQLDIKVRQLETELIQSAAIPSRRRRRRPFCPTQACSGPT